VPSFRSAKEQAHHAVSNRIALGESRHANKADGQVHSVGTARGYTQALAGFTAFIQENLHGDLKGATPAMAQSYLAERQEAGLSQKTLDLDRQALQCHLQQPLERVTAQEKTVLHTRSYTTSQIREIACHQSPRNALATEVAHAAGLRAHELHTLLPACERGASPHRAWSNDRFTGRDGERYTVEGKGGLVREVLIPRDLAVRLESARFDQPRQVTDRDVHYQKHYGIGGGKNWSTSFSRVSQVQLGWSNGAHGVRHSYAQERMDELQGSGFSRDDALATTAQEVGHFSPSTTEAYLR
jgi:integrase